MKAHVNVSRPVDRRTEGERTLGCGDVAAGLFVGGECYGCIGEWGLRVDPHERVTVQATEGKSLRRQRTAQ
jgi:hypothetical protein